MPQMAYESITFHHVFTINAILFIFNIAQNILAIEWYLNLFYNLAPTYVTHLAYHLI